MTAENYHLKWDSHLSYLNSSVATLYKNEKYADVVLYSSNTTGSVTNAMPTVGISAHKFILSSCSQFFSTIFETSPINNNGIFYIVLPPDLSHRAIQILVQYMYVGEATVSNDILSEVLRGGEILKIRGLCRTSTNTTSNTTVQQPQQNRNIDNQSSANSASSSSYNLTRMPMNSGPTSVRYLMEQQQQQHSRGLGASVMPKDSPVIIKSPKPLSTLASSTAGITKPPSSGITVNKQVAIDPGDYSQDSLPANPGVSEAPSSICNEIGCNSCPRVADNLQPLILRRERSQSDDPTVLCRKSCLERCEEQNYLRHASNDCRDEEEEEDSSRIYEHEMRRSSLPAERSDIIHDYAVTEHYPNHISHIAHTKHSIIRESIVGGGIEGVGGGGSVNEISPLDSPTNHIQQEPTPFVTIKEEPTDWLPSSSSALTHQNNVESSSKIISKVENFQATHIKTETSPSSSIHNMENDCRQLLAPAPSSVLQPPIANDFDRYFSCDICNKTCEDKASLVRHLETHTATPCSSGFNASTSSDAPTLSKSYVPKKRRRISQENTTDHVCLQCDLCTTRFETPAEWVRHMSSQHTEVELAMFNNKKDKEKNSSSTSSSNNHKKLNSNRQPHQQQQQQPQHPRTQVLNGSTNSNLSNSTSVLCTSPNQTRHEASTVTDYLRSTLSPA
ncbi:protein jim lovell isoform X3 [Lucilia sericata]|uniref:protein jim lovell isoform X3 n=1 Tax=Lucilia sericata TaxID=13632 RepID=UPI0018A84B43|nr:protein jim lovell isoform X3 [Lucilia sericata]